MMSVGICGSLNFLLTRDGKLTAAQQLDDVTHSCEKNALM